YALDGVDPRVLAKIQWAKRHFGRIYYNEGALRHILSQELGLPASMLNRGRGHRTGYGEREGAFNFLVLARRLPVLVRLQWGHRTANESEWLNPRWADAPEHVISLAAAFLRSPTMPDPAASRRNQARRREEVSAWVTTRLDPIRRAIFHSVLSRAKRAVRLRD